MLSQLDSASELKQQYEGRHVGHIFLIQSQLVFALTPLCCVLSGQAANIYFIIFGLIQPELVPTIYHTLEKHTNHYTTSGLILMQ